MSLQTNGKMVVVSDYIFKKLVSQVPVHKPAFIIGHFERRISFGYDADLAHVRADFDGLMLCIMVPRRISPFTITRTSPPAAVGRM